MVCRPSFVLLLQVLSMLEKASFLPKSRCITLKKSKGFIKVATFKNVQSPLLLGFAYIFWSFCNAENCIVLVFFFFIYLCFLMDILFCSCYCIYRKFSLLCLSLVNVCILQIVFYQYWPWPHFSYLLLSQLSHKISYSPESAILPRILIASFNFFLRCRGHHLKFLIAVFSTSLFCFFLSSLSCVYKYSCVCVHTYSDIYIM